MTGNGAADGQAGRDLVQEHAHRPVIQIRRNRQNNYHVESPDPRISMWTHLTIDHATPAV